MMEDRILTVDEVVAYLKIPKSTIYKFCQKKDLPYCKIGKQLRFRKSSLDKWIEQKETISDNPALASKPKYILIIDDDKLVLKAITRFLESHGYNTEPVESGEEALEEIRKSSFDLVITDVRMPGMDGISTLKKIRELNRNSNRPAIPEMIITGFADTEAERQAEELGIADYIYKPFVTTNFIEAIRNKLDLADAGQKETLSN